MRFSGGLCLSNNIAKNHRKSRGFYAYYSEMFNIGPCSFLLLLASRRCLCHGKRPPKLYAQQKENKEEVHRCEHHARSFCVWMRRDTTTTTWMLMTKRATIAQKSVASPLINNPQMKFLSVNTVVVSFARLLAEEGIAITARSASIL